MCTLETVLLRFLGGTLKSYFDRKYTLKWRSGDTLERDKHEIGNLDSSDMKGI
jgi:hypothetical protein